MCPRSARVELDPKKSWKARKLIQRQKETVKEVQQLKKEKEMQQIKGCQDAKNKP